MSHLDAVPVKSTQNASPGAFKAGLRMDEKRKTENKRLTNMIKLHGIIYIDSIEIICKRRVYEEFRGGKR